MAFHVPNQYRIRGGRMGSSEAIGNNGAFFVPSRPHDKRKKTDYACEPWPAA